MKEKMQKDGSKQIKPWSLAQYLIETGIKPLVFVGKSMAYFGVAPVVGFLLGIAITYGYALFNPLPYTIQATKKQPKISLQGKVLTCENQPLKLFEVGVLESLHGPFQEGIFNIDVPYKDKYDLVVWREKGDWVYRHYGGVNLVQAKGEYKLGFDLGGFPVDLGIVQGKVMDQDQRPVKGYVEIANTITSIEPDGTFNLKAIPLGRLRLRVVQNANGPVLYEGDINVSVTEATEFMPIVIKKE